MPAAEGFVKRYQSAKDETYASERWPRLRIAAVRQSDLDCPGLARDSPLVGAAAAAAAGAGAAADFAAASVFA